MPRRVDQLSVAAALASMNAALCRGPPGAVPLASATVSKLHCVPNGEQALPVRSELPAAENITMRLR